MKRRAVVSFIIAWLVGVAAYVIYYSANSLRESGPSVAAPARAPVDAPPAQAQGGSLPQPPPPPKTQGVPISTPVPEAARTLVGLTGDEVRQIEQCLPGAAHVATYPVGSNSMKAAVAKADLNGDGDVETVVVYKADSPAGGEAASQLFLGVLTREADRLQVRSSTPLTEGGVLFDIRIGGLVTPLAIQDVTGDGRPEIMASSGVGASLGGVLQVFGLDGLSLRHIGDIGGNSFQVATIASCI